MTLLQVVFVCLLVGVGSQDQNEPRKFALHSGDTHIQLQFTDIAWNGSKISSKVQHVNIHGDPARLHAPAKGLTALGRELDFTWAELSKSEMEFQTGLLTGDAKVIFDQEEALQSRQELAKTNQTPIPLAPTETSRMELTCETLKYKGDIKTGQIDMPTAWTLHNLTKGTEIQHPPEGPLTVGFNQSFEATGSKGTATVVQKSDGTLGKIATASFEGPVHFKVIRNETPVGSLVVSTAVYEGVADHMTVDLTTTPGTVKAEGHVVLDTKFPDVAGKGQQISANHTDGIDTLILKIDEQLQPVSMQMIGSPGRTTIKTKGGSR